MNQRSDPSPQSQRRSRGGTLLAASIVTLGAAFLSVLLVLDRAFLSPDVANYLGVANAFAHGNGFVEPIQWHYYLPGAPPQPAWAYLSPFISLVLAIPIAFGATFTGTVLVHALFASVVGGLVVVVARRFMSLPAALGAGVGLAWSAGWAQVTYFALTEPYAVLGVLLIVAAAPGVARSKRGALLCAVLTVFGWLTRANVPALALAVVVATLWEKRSWREKATDRRVWIYVAGVVGGIVAVRVCHEAVTGLRPYANYDAFFEMFRSWDLVRVDKTYVGTIAFMEANWDRVVARWVEFSRKSFALLFTEGLFHLSGYLFPLIFTWGVFGCSVGKDQNLSASAQSSSSGDAAADLQRRVCSFGAVGFLATTVLTYGGFEPRYLLLSACCAWLAGMASLDQIADRLSSARGKVEAFTRLVPLLLVLAVFAVATVPVQGLRAVNAWKAYGARSTTKVVFRKSGGLPSLCESMDPAFVAVATEAEALHFLCGNPTMRLPRDIGQSGNLARFLRERGPRYFVVERSKAAFRELHRSALLRRLAENRFYVLYEVEAFQGREAWRPPPSLACIGDDPPSCPRRSGM